MASIGTALINTLSHTDTEKLFIPWWDNLEDFVIYGLITLGLVILPTQVFAGTPLFCTPCLEVRSNSEITLQHLTLNIRMTNVGQT